MLRWDATDFERVEATYAQREDRTGNLTESVYSAATVRIIVYYIMRYVPAAGGRRTVS